MTVTFDSYLPEVLPWVPGCPESVAISRLRYAAIEFCKSTIWRETLTAIDAVAEQQLYPLAPVTADTLIHGATSVLFDGHSLDEKNANWLDLNWHIVGGNQFSQHSVETTTPWREYVESRPHVYHLESPTKLRLVGAPDAAATGAIVVQVALKPDTDAAGADDLLFNDWRLPIAAGALAELLLMNESWGRNPNLAGVYAARFAGAVYEATARAATNYQRQEKAVYRTRAYYR